jgi:hypothetical protein
MTRTERIAAGDVFRWETERFVVYYLIDHDLADIEPSLSGLHWCRLYFVDSSTGQITGYRTVLSPQYFTDMARAVGAGFARVIETSERQQVLDQVQHIPTPLRHAG